MVKEKKLRAAALRYDPALDDAPLLTAFGQGYVAEKIVALAEQAEIPVVYDAALADMLCKMSVGDEIPPELYAVVAQILVFISERDLAYGESLRAARK
jgi:flagellar biosynthesis protein